MPRLVGIGLALAALLGACASPGPKKDDGVSRAVNRTSEGFGDAAMQPLNDFNVRRVEIPARLAALISPYEVVPAANCKVIGTEVGELTKILGPDSDAPIGPEETLGQKAGDGAAGLALDSVASLASDFIPFRSVVREATGASAHERRLRAAYDRGVARRAYLKGIGAQMGCAPPAAPQPNAGVAPPGPPIEYRSKVQPGD